MRCPGCEGVEGGSDCGGVEQDKHGLSEMHAVVHRANGVVIVVVVVVCPSEVMHTHK